MGGLYWGAEVDEPERCGLYAKLGRYVADDGDLGQPSALLVAPIDPPILIPMRRENSF